MKVGAVILAGGKSSRMGQNKALLPINGLSNIERIKNKISEVFEDILLVANDREIYEFLHLPIVEDKVKEKGPLAGIQAGLLAAKHDANVFIACDMPFVAVEIANKLIEESEGYDVVIPVVAGKHQPLFAIYKKSILPVLEACLLNDQLRIKHLLDQVKVNYVSESQLVIKEIDNLEQVFYNMNHPSEYEKAKKIAEK
jgi:molybdenum cofactor guanylyltransferase